MHLFLVFFTFFLWSSSFTIGKAALHYTTPLFYTSLRMGLAGLLMLLFLMIRKKGWVPLSKKHWLYLGLLGLTAVYLTNFFEFWGLQYLSAAKACFIYSLSPFLAALFSYFQFKEKITFKKYLGLLIGFIGFLPVCLSQQSGKLSFSLGLPELSLVIATAVSVYGWIILRKLRQEGIGPVQANGVSMFLGGGFALVHSFFVDSWKPLPTTDLSVVMQSVVLMIIVSNLICFNLYGYLLKRFTATFLSVAGLMTPLFASLFGFLFLHEKVSIDFFFSVGILLIGLYFVYSEELKLGYILKAPKPSKL